MRCWLLSDLTIVKQEECHATSERRMGPQVQMVNQFLFTLSLSATPDFVDNHVELESGDGFQAVCMN